MQAEDVDSAGLTRSQSDAGGVTTSPRPRVMRPTVNCITYIFVVRNARIRACALVPGAGPGELLHAHNYMQPHAELELAGL